jgi:hypothetical protein
VATVIDAGEKKKLPTVTLAVPPVAGPVGESDPPPPPHPASARIARARITDFLRIATSEQPSHLVPTERS